MKKIILLGAIALLTITTNAAQFLWSAKLISTPSGVANLDGLTASLYCEALSSSALETTGTIKYFTVESIGNILTGSTFEITQDITGAELVKNTVYSFYFKIIDVVDASGNKWTYTSDIATASVVGSGASPITFGDVSATGTWTKTSNVPEPTSGLLLLCGLAGLALRRKRA